MQNWGVVSTTTPERIVLPQFSILLGLFSDDYHATLQDDPLIA